MTPYTSKSIQHSCYLMRVQKRYLSNNNGARSSLATRTTVISVTQPCRGRSFTTANTTATATNKRHYYSSLTSSSFNQYPTVYSIIQKPFSNLAIKITTNQKNLENTLDNAISGKNQQQQQQQQQKHLVTIARSLNHMSNQYNEWSYHHHHHTSDTFLNARYFHSNPFLCSSSNNEIQTNITHKEGEENGMNSVKQEEFSSYQEEIRDPLQQNGNNDHHHHHHINNNKYYSSQRNHHQQNQRNELINYTHRIMRDASIGSMSPQQIEDVRNLIYRWFATLNTNNTNNNNNNNNSHNNIPHRRIRDVAYIMETLLERLIEEYDEGLNEDALGAVRTKEYNVVLNAYGKCVSSYYNDNNSNWKTKFKSFDDDDDDDDENSDSNVNDDFDENGEDTGKGTGKSDFSPKLDPEDEYIAITKAEDLVKRMKTRYDNYANLFPDCIDDNNRNTTSSNSKRRRRLDDENNGFPPKPDIVTYNTLLSAYSNQYNNEKSVAKAEEIIKLLENEDEELEADTITYNVLIDIYANQIGEYGYAQKAEDVLLNMSKLRKEGSEIVKPNTLSFNTVLKAWRNTGGGTIEAAQRAEEILRLMIKLYLEGHSDVKPDGVSVSTVISAFTRPSNIPDEVIISHLDRILDVLVNETENFVQLEPKTVVRAFNTIIDNIAKSSMDDAGEKANYFIHKFIELSNKDDSPPELVPNHITYSNVIGACVKADDISNATKLLDRMIDDERLAVPPNAYCFNKCLQYHCTMKVNQEAAESLYRKIYNTALETGRIQKGDHAVIDIITYSFMIQLYQKLFTMNPSNGTVYIDKAIEVIKDMEEAYDLGISNMDLYPYHIITDLLQKDQQIRNGNGFKSHELLMKAIQHFEDGKLDHHPATVSCNFTLSALSKECDIDAAEKSSALIEHMEQMSEEGKNVKPDSHSFCHAMVSWTRSGAENTSENIKYLFDMMRSKYETCLDTGAYETALHGLSHNTRGDRKMAKEVVEDMISLSKRKESVEVSSTCLNMSLKAECQEINRNRNEMPAFGAHRLLFEYIGRFKRGEIDKLPDNIGFNTVILKWSQTPHREAMPKAEEIYNQMKRLSKKKELQYTKPDAYTYSNMLKVYSNSKNYQAPMRAENFVKRILDEDGSVNLDTYTYNGLLIVWARCIDPAKAVHARKWLDKMINLKKVDKLSHNIVLKACSQTRGSAEEEKVALDIALKTFNDILSSRLAPPDFITFATATKAINYLCKDKEERKRHLRHIFEECCSRGMLGSQVLKEMNYAIPVEEQVSYIGHDLNEGNFDSQWTRNV